jgi:hypothetical protein
MGCDAALWINRQDTKDTKGPSKHRRLGVLGVLVVQNLLGFAVRQSKESC